SQARPQGDGQVRLPLAGGGSGKTSTSAEWGGRQAASGQAGRIALVAATAADARDVLVEGASGILAVAPPWFRPVYEPSKRRLSWPNGAIATTFSAEEPPISRGGSWFGRAIAGQDVCRASASCAAKVERCPHRLMVSRPAARRGVFGERRRRHFQSVHQFQVFAGLTTAQARLAHGAARSLVVAAIRK